ncbi:cell surface glycoprotein 1-like isoform X2 [Anneissia japonica]|uniref:cell surface glycoprotein 1-like isoform X2 n=1 Tax=Anneissia japonica TaxID=1529436 RepID=UPI001425A6D3|nr:cell surface glycoprotein 1-like isoform X2 [Anneissia japonica]
MLVEIELELVEELKEVLKGVEIFLTTTLKRISLKKDVNEKNCIVASIKELLKKLNRISGNIDVDADSIELPDEEEGIDEVGPIPALQLKNSTKVGLLKKQQHGFGLQKNTRFCVIKANVMYYYKKMGDKKQAGAIVLDGYDVRPATQDDKKKEFAFELIHPTKRYYQFFTEDEPALVAWITAVRIATNKPTDSDEDEEINKEKEEERTMVHEDSLYATPLDEDETTENDPNHLCPPQDDHHADIHENQSTHIYHGKNIYNEIEEQQTRRPSGDLKDEDLYADIPEIEYQPTISHTSIPPTLPPRRASDNLIDEDSIPPPPSYPPPPTPDNLQIISKGEGQSDFQSFAAKIKTRVIKVDVPIVPKESQQNVGELYATVDKGSKSTSNKTKPLFNANGDPMLTKPELSPNKPNILVTLQDDQTLSASSTNIVNKPSDPMLPDEQILPASLTNKHSVAMPLDEQTISASSSKNVNTPSVPMLPDSKPCVPATSTNIRNNLSVPMPPDDQTSASSTKIENKPSAPMPPDDHTLSDNIMNRKTSAPIPSSKPIRDVFQEDLKNAIRRKPSLMSPTSSPKMSRKPPIVKPKPSLQKNKLPKPCDSTPSQSIGTSPAQAKAQSIEDPSPKTQHKPDEHL